MLRGAQAATALAVLLAVFPAVPFAAASAQIRVTGVLEGSLTLLPSSGPMASGGLASSPSLSLASVSGVQAAVVLPRANMAHGLLDAFEPDQPAASAASAAPAASAIARVAAPIEAIVSSNRDSILVWAPASDRVELRVEDDGEPSRTIECRRATDDTREPARCSAPEGRPSQAIARATLTVYYGLSGSR
ncbi:MAG TPA: hypothetical protein VH277_08990 [Gemmatimonadaceae bacterium]|nr:hypothetical protein [Gemmatimonadaceae bacterium]